MMPDTKWLPDDYIDETIPALRDSPTDSLWCDPRTGIWHVAAFDENGARDSSYTAIALTDGEIVGFSPHEDYGQFDAVVDDEGKLRAHFPPKANWFALDDHDTIGLDLQDLDNALREEGDAKPGDSFVVRAWWWGCSVPHRLVIDGATARFEVVQ